jgi:hypothetical protein
VGDPNFVSGGSGCFFGQIDRGRKLHRLNPAVALKLPNVFIAAPLDSNLQAIAGIHPKSIHLGH